MHTNLILLFKLALYPGAWADQRNRQVDNLVIPQCAGWITSYPPVINGYVIQTLNTKL